jgi:hypothetical protein
MLIHVETKFIVNSQLNLLNRGNLFMTGHAVAQYFTLSFICELIKKRMVLDRYHRQNLIGQSDRMDEKTSRTRVIYNCQDRRSNNFRYV